MQKIRMASLRYTMARSGKRDHAVQTLLDQGANPNLRCKLSKRPLFYAVERKRLGKAALILNHYVTKEDVNMADRYYGGELGATGPKPKGRTPLTSV
jgi:hypothetical protein